MLKMFIALKAWQVIVLVLIVCGIIGGFYAAYGQSSGSATSSSLAASTRLVQVAYGNLTSSVSASGSLVFGNKEDLTFGSGGTVQEVNVGVDDSVKEGDVLAELDNTANLSLQVAVVNARIALRNAQDALQNVQTPPGIADAQRAVQQAQQQLSNVQTQGPLNIANAQYAVDTATQNYNNSLAQFMNNKTTAQQLDNAKVQLDTANLNLKIAQQNADKAVADAQDNLTAAQQALANLEPDSLNLELKQLQVESAQSALDEALASLGNTTLVAPFDGIVSVVNIQSGQTVNAGTVAIEVVDPTDVEMNAIVAEVDISQVHQGQKAAISLNALSNEELSGEVNTISLTGNSQSGVVSYSVTIKLTVPSGVQLRQGMSATATITVPLATNILLVPTRAISGSSSTNPTVTAIVNGVPEVRSVKVGQSNGTSTEVLSGLNAGDEVVVTTSTTSTSSSSSSSSSPGGLGIGGFGGGGIISIGGR